MSSTEEQLNLRTTRMNFGTLNLLKHTRIRHTKTHTHTIQFETGREEVLDYNRANEFHFVCKCNPIAPMPTHQCIGKVKASPYRIES